MANHYLAAPMPRPTGAAEAHADPTVLDDFLFSDGLPHALSFLTTQELLGCCATSRRFREAVDDELRQGVVRLTAGATDGFVDWLLGVRLKRMPIRSLDASCCPQITKACINRAAQRGNLCQLRTLDVQGRLWQPEALQALLAASPALESMQADLCLAGTGPELQRLVGPGAVLSARRLVVHPLTPVGDGGGPSVRCRSVVCVR